MTIFNKLEEQAAEHILKQCATNVKSVGAYKSFLEAVKLRMELEGWTPPEKTKTLKSSVKS